MSRAFPHRIRAGWGRLRPRLLLVLPVLLLAAALALGHAAWRRAGVNAAIADLAAGRDRPAAAGAPAPLLLARALFLTRRGLTEEVEALIANLEAAPAQELAARARYALANARLRRAFAHLERSEIDPAGPLVALARQDYRRALQARPEFWDAKFNLDVASRLIRDFPEFDREAGDELKAEAKKIWTDIPGQPRGAP